MSEWLTYGYVAASFRYGLLQFRQGLADLHLKIYTDICRSYRSFQ
jgi:hypothetical protein